MFVSDNKLNIVQKSIFVMVVTKKCIFPEYLPLFSDEKVHIVLISWNAFYRMRRGREVYNATYI